MFQRAASPPDIDGTIRLTAGRGSDTLRGLWLVFAAIVAATAPAWWAAASVARADDVPVLWAARFAGYRSKTDCAYGERGCNRCVNNVEEQFRNLTQRDAHVARLRHWTMRFDHAYPPDGLVLNDVVSANFLDGHYQSFVRAASDPFAQAPNLIASYSHNAVFASRADAQANGQINSGTMTHAWIASGKHPGGIQAIGHYALYATEETLDNQAKLEIADLDAPSTRPRVIALPGMERVANVSATRVAGGGYLLLLAVSSYHTKYRLFYTASLERPHLETVLPEVTSDVNTGITASGEERNGFENLSMVSECGTGKTFVIGTTAPEAGAADGLSALYPWGKNFWMLYELVQRDNVVLRYVTKNTRDMFSPECDPRGSGTAFAGKNGELALYCHQKNNDVNSRRDLVGCGLSTAFGFASLAAVFCGLAIHTDPDIMFTEYWPRAPTSPSMVEVTVDITPGFGGVALGVLEESQGLVCRATTGPVTCKWTLAQGQQFRVIPFRTGGIFYSQAIWNGATQTSAEGGPCAGSRDANGIAPCTLTAEPGLRFGLNNPELL